MKNQKNIGWLIKYYLLNSQRAQAKKLIRDSDSWSKPQIEDFQYRQLKKLLEYAYYQVPYYTRTFNQVGFHPDDFKLLTDIRKVPVLTKEDIRNNQDDLISKSFPRKYFLWDTSGGTTGVPLSFGADIRTFSPVEWAYISALWRRMGYRYFDKYVVFRGEVIAPAGHRDLSNVWRYDRMRNCIVFSSFLMNDEVIPHYLKKIFNFKPLYIHSYPSTLYILADYMRKHGLDGFPFVKGIFLGSETLYPWQRDLFQSVFRTRLYRWYGHRERCVLGGEQEAPEIYELFPTYGYTELINRENKWCSHDGEEGEIFGTGFYNYAFPLIRYNTHDVADLCLQKTSHRNFMRISNIKGRTQDFFVDKSGSLITFSTSYRAVVHVRDKISAHQYVQNHPGQVKLKIETKVQLTEQELTGIRDTFSERFPLIDFELEIVKSIPRTSSGKFRYFIQNLNIDYKNFK